ncbi:MAG: hypothetical protein J0L50_07490 [Sphingomonadales bacterium]|nr:hypothetical protein [Sphingomonadales bacterium]
MAVIPGLGLTRQKLPFVQALADDGNWAAGRLSGLRCRIERSCHSTAAMSVSVSDQLKTFSVFDVSVGFR